ncbi:MAG TPA: prefoldin subunit alpha [Candidatus Nanoarchaeia archaeon]|nr:prefoldin subunit alpha [Candidatus Nanoarchaeia archaeon]
MSDDTALQQQEMQEVQQTLLHMQQQLQLLAHQLQELEQVKEAIVSMKHTKEGDEILVSLGGGVYTKAKVQVPGTVIMNVGAHVVVEKSTKDAEALVHAQIAELENIQKDMGQEFAHMSQQMQMLQLTQGKEE